MPPIDREDRQLRLRVTSAFALVGMMAIACDSQPHADRARRGGAYQVETALNILPPAQPSVMRRRPVAVAIVRPEPRPAASGDVLRSTAAEALMVPSAALTLAAPVIPVGPLAVPAIEPETIAPVQLVAIIPTADEKMADAGSAIDQVPTDLAYVPQINDSARAAYIAQVGAAAPGQHMAVRSGDQVLGQVEFQVANGQISVRIGQVLDLFQNEMDRAEFASLRASSAASEFVGLDRIQAARIPLDYNAAYDELTLDTARS